MGDFYEILEIEKSADSTQIRTAYKKLAMQYHPDRNAGDKEAEEIFKKINEAYHVLSDPLKKSRYDSRASAYQNHTDFSNTTWNDLQKRKYYQWKHSQQPYYRIDKNYFKIQGLAFLTFLIISGMCFGVIHAVNYYFDRQQMARWQENSIRIKKINSLFVQGHFDEAFGMINTFRKKEPLEFRFGFTRDSLISELRNLAYENYMTGKFKEAAYHYHILEQYELPVRIETLEKLATCEYNLGNYGETLVALKHLHDQQPWNLYTIYQIGIINLDHLNNPKESLHYFSLGKKLFKDNLTEVYGAAFEVVMNPTDIPHIYYLIFEARARNNLILKHYDEALKDCNWAVYLQRDHPDGYKLRAQVRIASQNFKGVCSDITEAKKLGANVQSMLRHYCW